MKQKFEPISTEYRKELEEAFFEKITTEYRKDMIEEEYYKYEAVIQDVRFRTYMSDDELKRSIMLTMELMEELKEINNNGMDRAALDMLESEIGDVSRVSKTLKIYHALCTDKLHLLMAEIDEVRRVGGAYAMLLANPFLISAVYSIYDRLVDNFDDEDLYMDSVYFMIRAVMKMNSNEI